MDHPLLNCLTNGHEIADDGASERKGMGKNNAVRHFPGHLRFPSRKNAPPVLSVATPVL